MLLRALAEFWIEQHTLQANHSLHLGETAVHKQFRSRDVAAVVRCEKHHGPGDLIGCTEPAERNAAKEIGSDCGNRSI